uniref:Uncharacterized protein n=1 Tax=Picea glauca TaxID=3330 RepID=A0A101LV92_PICGL|nr:hypothetical protein ABT39_MTgene2344 [Picea glauca]QHR92282.1 hypothetical protein Q903MT_gene6323 [Picea sitchensis]
MVPRENVILILWIYILILRISKSFLLTIVVHWFGFSTIGIWLLVCLPFGGYGGWLLVHPVWRCLCLFLGPVQIWLFLN